MTSTRQPVDHAFVRSFADRWHEAWNAHDPDRVVALCAPGIVLEQSSTPVRYGHAGVAESVAELVRASNDFRFEETAPPCLSPDGGMAVVPWRFTGTMTGPLPPGFAPTRRTITFEGDDHWQFEGDRLVRCRVLFDVNDMAVQIGAAPAPGSAGEKAAVLLQRLTAWTMRRRGR
jgi:SnoaL-like domain